MRAAKRRALGSLCRERTNPPVADFVPCVRPKGECRVRRVPSLRRKVERRVELDGGALWLVGGHRDASVELTEKTLDDLEAEACPRLVDIEILREADSLI